MLGIPHLEHPIPKEQHRRSRACNERCQLRTNGKNRATYGHDRSKSNSDMAIGRPVMMEMLRSREYSEKKARFRNWSLITVLFHISFASRCTPTSTARRTAKRGVRQL